MKNLKIVLFLLCVFMCLIPVVSASYAQKSMPVNIGAGHDPAIYSDKVVWTDGNINTYNLTTGASGTFHTLGANQVFEVPDVYGVVTVFRITQPVDGVPKSIMEVYNETRGLPLYIGPVNTNSTPRIYENKIVWTNNGNIIVYDVSSPTHVPEIHIGPGSSPDIYGDRVVYVNDTKQICIYNLTTEKITGAPNSKGASNPRTYANYIVWSNHGGAELSLYNICSGRVVDVANSNIKGIGNFSISGSWIAYAETKVVYDKTGKHYVTVMNAENILTKRRSQIYIAPKIGGVDVYDRTIVWESSGNIHVYSMR